MKFLEDFLNDRSLWRQWEKWLKRFFVDFSNDDTRRFLLTHTDLFTFFFNTVSWLVSYQRNHNNFHFLKTFRNNENRPKSCTLQPRLVEGVWVIFVWNSRDLDQLNFDPLSVEICVSYLSKISFFLPRKTHSRGKIGPKSLFWRPNEQPVKW